MLNNTYICFLACKVYGLKKIKVFNIKDLHKEKIWDTEANSINYFTDGSSLMMKLNVYQEDIYIVFVNGSE